MIRRRALLAGAPALAAAVALPAVAGSRPIGHLSRSSSIETLSENPAIEGITQPPPIGGPFEDTAIAQPSDFDLQRWLDEADPVAVVDFHLTRLADALQRQHGGTWKLAHYRDNGLTVAARQRPDGTDVWVEFRDA